MILPSLVVVLVAGGVASWIAARRSLLAARWIAVASVVIDMAMTMGILISRAGQNSTQAARWFVDYNIDWIPQFGIRIHLAIDGLSLALLLLTYFLGVMAVLASWTEIQERANRK